MVKNYSISLETNGFCHVLNITDQVREYVVGSGVSAGVATLFVMGSTAEITTLEYEPGCVKDFEELFNKLAPLTLDYHHEQAWHDGNGFSHVRASLLKPSLVVPLEVGKLKLGAWQKIVVVDFDNRQRSREVAVQVMGE